MATKHAPNIGSSRVKLPVISMISTMPVTGAHADDGEGLRRQVETGERKTAQEAEEQTPRLRSLLQRFQLTLVV